MNIMINSYCNLQCPYCFADNEINVCDEKTMSMEVLEDIIELHKKNGIKRIRLIGGEPTLHPYFGAILDRLVSENYFENIHIFSNMTFNKEIRDLLTLLNETTHISILPNFNSIETTKEKYELVKENIKILAKEGIIKSVGINLYKKNMDLKFLFDLVLETKIDNIRWAITVPNHEINNNFDFKGYFNQFFDTLVELFTFCNNNKISSRIDCNSIPQCAFTPEQIATLVRLKPDIFAKNTECYPVIDINPKLEAFRCFGLSDLYKTQINKYTSIRKLEKQIIDETKEYSEKVVLEECKDCDVYKFNGNNCCSCVAYRKNK